MTRRALWRLVIGAMHSAHAWAVITNATTPCLQLPSHAMAPPHTSRPAGRSSARPLTTFSYTAANNAQVIRHSMVCERPPRLRLARCLLMGHCILTYSTLTYKDRRCCQLRVNLPGLHGRYRRAFTRRTLAHLPRTRSTGTRTVRFHDCNIRRKYTADQMHRHTIRNGHIQSST